MGLTITDQTLDNRLLNILSRLNQQQSVTMTRLATAKRINRAADDPAGLIAANLLSHEIAGVDAAYANASRADAMLNVADSAVTQISSLLTQISSLAVASVGSTVSDAERAANQSQIDSAIEAIDRIVRTTTFNGQRLIDGSQAITTYVSGADAAHIRDVDVSARPSHVSSAAFVVNVASAATKASTASVGWVDMGGANATVSAATTMVFTGELGAASITIASGSNQSQVISAINAVTGLTGVTAAASGTAVRLESQNYGADAFVSVSVLSGDEDFVDHGNLSKISGTDAKVTVNGATAGADGDRVYWSGNGYAMSFTLADNTTGTRTITVTGGGATFQLGPDGGTKSTIGVSGMYSTSLGQAGIGYLHELRSGGSKDLLHDVSGAVNVARAALTQVTTAAGRIGGFQKYQIESAMNTLSKAKEGLSAARSLIEDADIAAETAALSRNQLLIDTVTSLFAVANTQRRNIVSLFSPFL